MSAIEDKLKAMGLKLPPARKFPSPNRRGCVRAGNIIFVSGHGPHHPTCNSATPASSVPT
jgi:hypothetical protein